MTAQCARRRPRPQDCYEVVPSCPTCNSPLAGDEIFCLQCGTRLVPEPEPRPSWTVPTVIIGGIALLAVAGVFFALEQVESDAEREATKPARVVETPSQRAGGGRPAHVAAWPEGDSAFTVVLARAPDEASARAQATAALSAGVPVGVLDSDRYPTLEPGAWMLFTGRFQSRDDAAAEAARYKTSGFPKAQARFVSEDEAAIR